MLSIMLEKACQAQLIAMAAGSFRQLPREKLWKNKRLYIAPKGRAWSGNITAERRPAGEMRKLLTLESRAADTMGQKVRDICSA